MSFSATAVLLQLNSEVKKELNLQYINNDLLNIHFVLEVAPFTIQLMRAVSSNVFEYFAESHSNFLLSVTVHAVSKNNKIT